MPRRINGSVPCRKETRNRIRALKRGNDDYDDVLRRLLADYEAENE